MFDNLIQLAEWGVEFVSYGAVGTATAVGLYRYTASIKGYGNVDGDDTLLCAIGGLFWFIGIWVFFMLCLVKPRPMKAEFPDLDEREKGLRKRAREVDLDRVEIEIARKEAEIHATRMRELK